MSMNIIEQCEFLVDARLALGQRSPAPSGSVTRYSQSVIQRRVVHAVTALDADGTHVVHVGVLTAQPARQDAHPA